ncbi:MAG: ferritin [Deltaproteobacteria bacterium]|nr:ferritin [Candidatus Tharpella aukensis]
MINERVEKALNEQVNAEIYSAYLYLSMSSYFESVNLPGFAQWMKAQAQEEMVHGMKIYDFIHERGGRVLLSAIEAPQTEWANPVAVFVATLEHEQKVTALINGLVDIAIAEKDHATNIFLQWFVTEQVEEEASVDAVLQKLKMVGDQGHGLFMMDRELGARGAVATS